MRFPDRPVLNGILGVVCALVVLALLSWPGIVGPSRAPSFMGQSAASSSSSSMGVLSSSTSYASTIGSNSLYPVSSSSTIPQSSSQPASSVGTGSGVSTSISGSSNLPLPVTSSTGNYSFSPASPTVESNSTISHAQTNTSTMKEITTLFSEATTMTAVSSSVSQSNHGTSPSQFSPEAAPVVGIKSFQTLGILSLGSVIIAVGCTLFVYKRMEREEEGSD